MEKPMRKNAVSIIALVTTALIAVVLLVVVSCSRNREPGLKVEISEPRTGAQFYANREIVIHSLISGDESWSRIELWANNELVQSKTAAQVQSNAVRQAWTPSQASPTMIEVRVYNRSGKSYVSSKIAITIVEPPGALTPEPTLAPGEPTPTSQPTQANCTTAATLLADLSIPDGTELKAGQSFTKSWRVHNNGSCDWVDYKLVYISGSLMGGNSPNALRNINAGEVVDIGLELSAPRFPGEYTGIWKIQTDKGSLLDAELKYRIIIPGPTATPSPTATQTNTTTPTNTPTQTPTLVPTATNTPMPTATATQVPTSTTVPSQTPVPTTEPTPEPSQVPGPYTIIAMNPKDINKGETLELSVSCNDVGGQAVSGGYTVTNGINITASQRIANGWSITATNTTNRSQRISVHVNCLVDPNLKVQVNAEENLAPANEISEFKLISDVVIAGSGYALDPGNTLSLLESRTESNQGYIKVNNPSNLAISLNLQTIGFSRSTYASRYAYPKSEKIKPNETKQITLTCGQGLAISANYERLSDFSITINRPVLNGWLFEVSNKSTSELEFKSELVCFDQGFQSIQPIIDIQLH